MKTLARKLLQLTAFEQIKSSSCSERINRIKFSIFRIFGTFVHIPLELALHKKVLKSKRHRSRNIYSVALKVFLESIKPAFVQLHSLTQMLSSYSTTVIHTLFYPRNTKMNTPIEVGYVRVSSREQAEDSNALEQQRARIQATPAEQIFEDIQPGSQDNRPNFQQMMEQVRKGKIKKIYITRIDRITRSLMTLKLLVEELEEHEVTLAILDQNLDLSTPQGRLMLNLLGMLAEWEIDLMSERIKHGKAHARKQKWANGSCPFGYVVKDHKYYLDDRPYLCLLEDRPDNYKDYLEDHLSEEVFLQLPKRTVAQVARDCIELVFEYQGVNRGLQAAQRRYGFGKTLSKRNGTDSILHWSKTGFSLWLINPILDGHTCYLKDFRKGKKRLMKKVEDWNIICNTHPDQRLLKDGERDELLRLRKRNMRMSGSAFFHKEDLAPKGQNYKPFAWQTGLVFCGECGSLCTQKSVSHNGEQKYAYYACRHSGYGCNNKKSMRKSDIENAVIKYLLERSKGLNAPSEEADNAEKIPKKSRRQLDLEEQLLALENFPRFNLNVEAIKEQIQQQIREEINPFMNGNFDSQEIKDLIRAGNNLGIWQTLTNDDKTRIFQHLIHKIIIHNGEVEKVILHA
ncbi:fdxN element excision recombinase XisF [Nodosilinea sp. AN01ver1]|uniref:fdxN element excision recombinase XisF n=1 Tax=Nodosilinea sp. AN01ver1 TaxID=3423362 RepID=UPI003D31DC3A